MNLFLVGFYSFYSTTLLHKQIPILMLLSLNLQLKALGIDNILGFDWLASPSPEAMVRALEVLYSLGILDEDAKLTSPTGFQVAEIPLVCFPFKLYFVSKLLLYLLYDS